jgi:hypothetical protein
MEREAWLAQKTRLIEELLRLTAQMHQSLMKNKEEQFEIALGEREEIFRQLADIDQHLQGQPTDRDDLWTRQLKMIESQDAEILNFLLEARGALSKEVTHTQKVKEGLFQSELIDPKGHSVSVKG